MLLSKRNRQRVLVVDNNIDAATSMTMLLRLWGYDAESCFGGAAALESARAHPPNIVLLDVGMPEVDGFQVARELRSEPAFAETVVIGITGWGTETYRCRAREFGFDHYLLKPADLDQLQELLVSAAAGREAFAEILSSRPALLPAEYATP